MIRILRQTADEIASLLHHKTAESDAAVSGDVPSPSSGAIRETPRAAVTQYPHLRGIRGLYEREVVPLVGTRFIIGRSDDCDLSIPKDTRLSPRHLRLFFRDEQWQCLDLKSASGTFVNDVRLGSEPVVVPSGGRLRCGEQEFRVMYGGEGDVADTVADTEPIPPKPDPAPMPPPVIPVAPFPIVAKPLPNRVPASRQVIAQIDLDASDDTDDASESLEDLLLNIFGAAPQPPKPRTKSSQKSMARWVPPGESITIGGVTLPDGMIYVGSSLGALTGSGQESALILPDAKIDASSMPARPDYQEYAGYYSSYATIRPTARRRYLQWLADGRGDPGMDTGFAQMFFYGLERRLVGPLVSGATRAAKAEPLPNPEETAALRRELARLASCCENTSLFDRIQRLLQFLDVKELIDRDDPAALPDPNGIIAMEKSYNDLPPLLEFALARMAESKQPLSADWAWAWFLHDSDSTLRSPAVRCPNEVRRLFSLQFAQAQGSKGIRLRLVKTPLTFSYMLANPSCYNGVTLSQRNRSDFPTWLRQVSRSPLNAIRETAYLCMYRLDAYSRRVGRNEELRDTLPVVALLPDPLFAEHPATERFRAYLDALVPSETGQAGTVPIRELLSLWCRRDSVTGFPELPEEPEVAPLSRGEVTTLLESTDRLGFVVEPDLRLGGATLSVGKEGDAVAAVARRIENTADATPVAFTVGLSLLVRAARVAGNTLDTAAIRHMASHLPQADRCEPGRFAARLAYLIANPKESAKLPRRQEPALAALTPEQKSQIADVLAETVSQSGAVSPAMVAELIRLFALLGLPDSDLYSRLHSSAVAHNGVSGVSSVRSGRKGASVEPEKVTATVPAGRTGARNAPPKPTKSAAKREGGVAIDHALVQQKLAESEHIGSLLADIFTAEDAADGKVFADVTAVVTPTVALPPAPAQPGALETRHTALLRSLLEKDSWTRAEVATLARAANLLPNAAIEAINEAAYERFEEPVLEGEDPVYVVGNLARELLG